MSLCTAYLCGYEGVQGGQRTSDSLDMESAEVMSCSEQNLISFQSPSNFKVIIYLQCVYAQISEDNMQELVLSQPCEHPWATTQVVRLSGKCF